MGADNIQINVQCCLCDVRSRDGWSLCVCCTWEKQVNCVELRSHACASNVQTTFVAQTLPKHSTTNRVAQKLKVKALSDITPHIVVLIAFSGGSATSFQSVHNWMRRCFWGWQFSQSTKTGYIADGMMFADGETSTEGCHKIILNVFDIILGLFFCAQRMGSVVLVRCQCPTVKRLCNWIHDFMCVKCGSHTHLPAFFDSNFFPPVLSFCAAGVPSAAAASTTKCHHDTVIRTIPEVPHKQ